MPNAHETLLIASALLGGYLLGSIASAILVCRALGLPDPRTLGSGNPGATNVLRTGSRTAAGLTLLGDLLKGALAVLLARAASELPGAWAGAGLGAFLGHLYPLYFRFRGGKGVATALGATLALAWLAGLLALLTWLAVTLSFRISSLAALSTFTLVPAYLWLLGSPGVVIAAVGCMSALLFWRHRGNVRRLLQGTESRVGQ